MNTPLEHTGRAIVAGTWVCAAIVMVTSTGNAVLTFGALGVGSCHRGRSESAAEVGDHLPTASNVFVRARLRDVRTELLESVDRVERAAMTLEEPTRDQRATLVEGILGDAGGCSLFSLTP